MARHERLDVNKLHVKTILVDDFDGTGASELSGTEVTYLDGLTIGTVTASKAVVVDANKDIGDFRNLDAVNIDAGASGTAGTVDVFPTTAAKGKLILAAVDNDGDTNTTISNAAMGQASVVSIPDPGAATANFVLTDAANDGVVVTSTAAQLNTVELNPGKHAYGHIEFNAVGTAAMSITIDGVVYLEADAEDFPNGVWTNGASAADSATSLISAINGDTRAAVPFTAVADSNGDGVWLIYDAVGVNAVTVASSTGDATVVTPTAGGAAAARNNTIMIQRTVTTQELLSGEIVVPLPFTPGAWMFQVRTSTGLVKAVTDLATVTASPDLFKLNTDGATNAGNTDVLTVWASE
jgi:hypothetical protein